MADEPLVDDLGKPARLPDEVSDTPEQEATEEKPEEEGEQQAEAVSEETADDADAEEEDAESERPKRRRPGKAARKITRLEAENQELRERMARLEGAQQARPTASPQTEDRPPQEQDYEDRDDYLVAKAEYNALQRFRAESAERERKQQEASLAEQQRAVTAKWETAVAEAREEHEDWDDVIPAIGHHVTDTMLAVIAESDRGPEVLYSLAQDPSEAARISKLSPARQALEVGKVEARLEAQPTTPPKKQTSAPPPPPKVKTGTGATTQKSPDDMTMDEFAAWRNKQIAEKRSRLRA